MSAYEDDSDLLTEECPDCHHMWIDCVCDELDDRDDYYSDDPDW